MDHIDQSNAFYGDLEKLVDRYSDEFDLSYAAVIGVLQMMAIELTLENREMENED